MLSLWALFLLSAMVISWALEVGSRLTMSGNASRGLEAQALACSGAEIAQIPLPNRVRRRWWEASEEIKPSKRESQGKAAACTSAG